MVLGLSLGFAMPMGDFARIVNFVYVVLIGFLGLCDACTFTVGGDDGWTLKPSENYSHWAERNRFQINDTLVFKYEKEHDSVYIVNKKDYSKCNKDDPIKTFKDGNTHFTFDKSGPFFFISGHDQNCEKGQKLIIVVLSEHHHHNHTVPSPPPVTPTHPPTPSPAAKSPTHAPTKPPSPSTNPSHAPRPTRTPSHAPPVEPPSHSPSPSSPKKAPTPAPNHSPAPTPAREARNPSQAPPPSHSPSHAPPPSQQPSHSPSPSSPYNSPAPSPTHLPTPPPSLTHAPPVEPPPCHPLAPEMQRFHHAPPPHANTPASHSTMLRHAPRMLLLHLFWSLVVGVYL